jgi:hypothetical protein
MAALFVHHFREDEQHLSYVGVVLTHVLQSVKERSAYINLAFCQSTLAQFAPSLGQGHHIDCV